MDSGVVSRGHFEEERRSPHCWIAAVTHGDGVSIVKCLRTHRRRHCEPFSGQKCTRLHDFADTISEFFRWWCPRTPPEASLVLGARHQFPLGSPAFPSFLFYETTTGCWSCCKCVCVSVCMSNFCFCLFVHILCLRVFVRLLACFMSQ